MSELKKRIFHLFPAHLLLFLLPSLCVLLYFPSLYYDFVYDDGTAVVDNPYIKSWSYWSQMLTKDAAHISDPVNYWRPVYSISLALDYSLWGLNPIGFRLTNILLHAINTALLFSLGRKLQNATGALLSSLLFAFHPIQTFAVSGISQRADLLAAFFALLSLQAFFSRRMVPFATALILALLSKETSMVLPLVLFFASILLQRGKQDLRVILAFAVLAIYLLVRFSLGFSFTMIPLVFSYDASWDARVLLAFKVLALYFLAIGNLFEMPHPVWTVEVPTSLNDPYVLSGVFILLSLLGVIWRNLKKNPLMAFGLAWFLVYWLPLSNLKQINTPMAEHWLYIPMVGLSLAFGTGLERLLCLKFPRAELIRAGIKACIAVFLIFAVLVVREKAQVYRSNETFFLAAVRANPQNASLYSLLGNVYFVKENFSKAKGLYTQSLTLDPGDFVANYMLGRLLYQEGRQEEAKTYLERIARVKPVLTVEFSPVAHAWEMLGNKEKALFYYRKGLEVNPQLNWFKEKVASLEDKLNPRATPFASPR